MSLWSELKRRNVFRVGVAYLAGTWLLLQVASVVLPSFDAPPWAMQAVIFASILGFPVAVVLAWLYEWTPQGIKPTSELAAAPPARFTGRKIDFFIIGILVVAVLFLALDDYIYDESIDVAALDSIAVLAFENLSSGPDDDYIADGLADEILSTLGRIDELRVASRLASLYFKGKDTDPATIAETLQVDYILSGGLRKDGDRIRVTAALDQPSTGELLWSETFDGQVSDVLDIQRGIARSVATAIVPVLSERSERQFTAPVTDSAEAYDYYLRGREYLREPNEESTVASAVQLFERAIGLDAGFPHAYAGLCEAHLDDYYLRDRAESFEQAERACHQALALDDSLWEVRLALGDLYRYSGRYDDAVRELELAIADQPSAVGAYLSLAQTYAAEDLVVAAESTFRKAAEIDRGYWRVYNETGNFLWHVYRYEEAIPYYERVIDLAPDSGIGHDNLAVAYQALGQFEESVRILNSSPLPSRWTYTNRGLDYYYLGEYRLAVEDELKAIDLAPDVHESWGRLADAYRFIPGEEENARAAYEEAIKHAESQLRINPSDWDTLSRLTTYYAYTEQSRKAADGLETLFELTSDPLAYYFAALTSLKLGDVDHTIEYLEQVLKGGWSRATISADPDLASLRGTPEFDALLDRYAD